MIVFEKNHQTLPEGDRKGTLLLYTIMRLYRCEKATSPPPVDLMALYSKRQWIVTCSAASPPPGRPQVLLRFAHSGSGEQNAVVLAVALGEERQLSEGRFIDAYYVEP